LRDFHPKTATFPEKYKVLTESNIGDEFSERELVGESRKYWE